MLLQQEQQQRRGFIIVSASFVVVVVFFISTLFLFYNSSPELLLFISASPPSRGAGSSTSTTTTPLVAIASAAVAVDDNNDRADDVYTSPVIHIPRKGKIQYHHHRRRRHCNRDDATTSSASSCSCCCDAVVMIHVGAAMSVTDYQDLGRNIVTAVQHEQSLWSSIVNDDNNADHDSSSDGKDVVAIIMDDSPGRIRKQDGTSFSNLANAIVDDLPDLIPTCRQQRSQEKPPRSGYYLIGGHSAGGEGAVRALQVQQRRQQRRNSSTSRNRNALNFNVSGFVGLAPYEIDPEEHLTLRGVPSLLWGLKSTSCMVDPQKASVAAYEIGNPRKRVLYQINDNDNDNGGGEHCSFADRGCMNMCAGKPRRSAEIRALAGYSIHLFLRAISSGESSSFRREQFDLHHRPCRQHHHLGRRAPPQQKKREDCNSASSSSSSVDDIDIFVNEQEPGARH